MNFSITRTLRKILSLTAAILLLTCLFTGCLNQNDVTDTTESQPSLNLDTSDPSDPTDGTVPPTTTEPIEINENMATVTNQLSVYASPAKDARVMGTLDAGIVVEITSRHTVVGIEWGRIAEPIVGWICLDYVDMLVDSEDPGNNTDETTSSTDGTEPSATESVQETNIKGVITASQLNIRSEASTTSDKVGSYVKGDVVTILEQSNGWGRTSKGWISMEYVNTTGDSGTNDNTGTDDNTGTSGNDNTTGNGSTTVIAKGIVTAASGLNVRSTASTDGDKLGNLPYGTRVEILEKSGDWGRTEDGWISLNYVYQDGTTGTNTAKGIVTGNGLNIRTGPGTNYDSSGSYNSGDRVTILEQFTYNDVTWGCTNKGWISLDYVYIDGTDVGQTESGVMTGNDVNIRSGPGTGYDSVGSLDEGDEVEVFYQVEVGDTAWGCISDGWVCMDYVSLG